MLICRSSWTDTPSRDSLKTARRISMSPVARWIVVIGTMLAATGAQAAPTQWVIDSTYPDLYGKGAPFFSEVPGAPSGNYKTTINNYPILTGAISFYNPQGAAYNHSAIYFEGQADSSTGVVGANNSFFAIALAGSATHGTTLGGNVGWLDHTKADMSSTGHTLRITVTRVDASADDRLQIMWMPVTDAYLSQFGANGQNAIYLSNSPGQSDTFLFKLPSIDPHTNQPVSTIEPDISFEVVNYSTRPLRYTIKIEDISAPALVPDPTPSPSPLPPVYPFTALDDPANPGSTRAAGINDNGQIIGTFSKILNGMAVVHGFLRQGDAWSNVDNSTPRVFITMPTAINGQGHIVGRFQVGLPQAGPIVVHGFLLTSSTWIILDSPNAVVNNGIQFTAAYGINNRKQIVGAFADIKGTHGFLLDGAVWTNFDHPDAYGGSTEAYGINDAGVIIGIFQNETFVAKGFIFENGGWSTFSAPWAGTKSSQGTYPHCINADGKIVGSYIDEQGLSHGFLYYQGAWTQIDVPYAVNSGATGISDAGLIVGWFNIKQASYGYSYKPE